MRFVVQHKKANYINFLVVLFSLGFYFFIFSFLGYKYLSKEFFPAQIILALKGNPDIFLEPKDLVSIIENLHIETFLLIVFFLTIFSILIRTNIKNSLKLIFIFLGFLSVFIYISSIFAIRYLADIFSYIYFISLITIFVIGIVVNSLNLVYFSTGKIK